MNFVDVISETREYVLQKGFNWDEVGCHLAIAESNLCVANELREIKKSLRAIANGYSYANNS